ncbi:Uu.00g056900.m01.CDS01 [Anthostomella pinea]|uniref:Uu.00g056900.m01.CDS01 n=1 Tax=Anthostomella pinea TaxID=933095 RepID=A0AAI8VL17_9PEZI|nr:Uu.00g056900.m01.CDS01 [Anthostomella pinea]
MSLSIMVSIWGKWNETPISQNLTSVRPQVSAEGYRARNEVAKACRAAAEGPNTYTAPTVYTQARPSSSPRIMLTTAQIVRNSSTQTVNTKVRESEQVATITQLDSLDFLPVSQLTANLHISSRLPTSRRRGNRPSLPASSAAHQLVEDVQYEGPGQYSGGGNT